MEIPAPDDERRLDRIGHRSPRDRAWLGAAGRLAGRGVERHDLQPAPEAAVGAPRPPPGIDDMIGVSRVGTGLRTRWEHHAHLPPSAPGPRTTDTPDRHQPARQNSHQYRTN